MSKYLAPLGVFIGGNLLLLILFIFLPSIGTAGNTLAAHPNASTFWGMTWLAGGVKIIVFVLGELVVLGATFIAILKSKS